MHKIGILAGRGDLVELLLKACVEKDLSFHIIAFEGQTDKALIEPYAHSFVELGKVGKTVAELKKHGCNQIVMAGYIDRPSSWSSLKPDFKGALLLAKIAGKSLGDDGLFRIIIEFLEKENFTVISAETLIGDEQFCDIGLLTTTAPDKQALSDIQRGLEVLKNLSPVDVGQACIVQHGLVLGIEALEGTDQLIARCGLLKQQGAGPILIKMLKIGQDERVDRSTIGVQTIINCAKAGVRGLAVEAKGVILLNKFEIISQADQLGIFVLGVTFENQSHY